MGKGVVGKSSLTYLYINYNAPKEHDPTIEDRYKTYATINSCQHEIEIMDTAGEDDYQNMMDNWINFGEGFLLVFAINDEQSFQVLEKKRERILKTKNGVKCPIVLVGNKKDLEAERKIAYQKAKAMADSWDAEYIETSALTKENYKEAFEILAKKIVEIRFDPINVKNRRCCGCNII